MIKFKNSCSLYIYIYVYLFNNNNNNVNLITYFHPVFAFLLSPVLLLAYFADR
jgi:hypothetical protein